MKWQWPMTRETMVPAAPEKKQVILGLNDTYGAFMIMGKGRASSASSALHLYQDSTAVATPIDMIADAFSIIDLGLQVGDELMMDHPVLDFLKQPSPFHDQELFLNVMAKNYLITGEAMFVAVGNINLPPLQLQPVSPSAASPNAAQQSDAASSWIIAGQTLPGSYVGDVFKKEVRYLDGNLREFKLIRNYSPKDNSLLRGQSLLVAASREIRSHILGTEHNVQLLENGGRVSMVFNFEADMNQDDFDAAADAIVSKYGGASNAGEIAVTGGGKLTVAELGKTPKDMDYASLQSLVQKAVALRYKVPLPLISDERQTLNNYAIGNLALYDQAVLPLSNRILGGIGNLLLPRYDLDPKKVRLVPVQDSVTALVIRRNDELKKRVEMNLETKNELRALIGREEIEGGDELYQSATLVPIGTDLFTDDNDPNVVEPVLGGASDKPDTDPKQVEPAEPVEDEDEE